MSESLGFLFTAATSINYLLLYPVAVKKNVALKGQKVCERGNEGSIKNSSVSGKFDRITLPFTIPPLINLDVFYSRVQ